MDKYRYKYPLIQYKLYRKNPCIVCIEDGIDQIHEYFKSTDHYLTIKNKKGKYNVKSLRVNSFVMQAWDKMFKYKIINWLALNQENYKRYKECENNDKEQKEILAAILKGNILSFAKGIDWTVDREIDLKVVDIERVRLQKFKGQGRLAFNVSFLTNVFLPNYIGLGKGSSVGFGTVKQFIEK
ncbi:MAG: hypothetical protein Kow0068_19760 [Marinilabiliales bacterium]